MSAGIPAVAIAAAEAALSRFQHTAVEIIGGPGGVLVLVAGVMGLAVLSFDVVALLVRACRRFRVRRAGPSTPAARVRGLASLGADAAEIARATGLPRDVLALVAADALPSRTKVPAAAETAAQSAPSRPATSTTIGTQAVMETKFARPAPATPKPARPLPPRRARNANAPAFGEAA